MRSVQVLSRALPFYQPWWTPQYLWGKLSRRAYDRSHPDEPWFNRFAIRALDSLLRPTDVGLEFGSGRSTIWLARRVARLTSVEHDGYWFGRVQERLADLSLENVSYLHRPGGAFVSPIDDFADDSLDFVLVDGGPRPECARRAIPKLRRGGILIMDDAHKFFPCRTYSPKPRTPKTGPGPGCEALWEEIRHWRSVWTTDHVTDTAMWIKP